MIESGRDDSRSEPGSVGRRVYVAAAVRARRALVETNNKQRVRPIRAPGNKRRECLQECVTLSGRAVVHIVNHVWNDKREIDRRIEVGQWLNIGALKRIEPGTFKTDRWIVFANV